MLSYNSNLGSNETYRAKAKLELNRRSNQGKKGRQIGQGNKDGQLDLRGFGTDEKKGGRKPLVVAWVADRSSGVAKNSLVRLWATANKEGHRTLGEPQQEKGGPCGAMVAEKARGKKRATAWKWYRLGEGVKGIGILESLFPLSKGSFKNKIK